MLTYFKYLFIVTAIFLLTACGGGGSDSAESSTTNTGLTEVSTSSSLIGDVPNGNVFIKMCINESAECFTEVTSNGHFSFSSFTLENTGLVTLELRQEGKIPFEQELQMHQGKNFFGLESFSDLEQFSYTVGINDIYIGVDSFSKAYIGESIEVGSQYVYKLDVKQLNASVSELKIEIGIQENNFLVNDLLSTKNIYIKIYDQDMKEIVLQSNAPASNAPNAPSLTSSYIGECQGTSYFYLNESEDSLLKDENQEYIDVNPNEAGIQVGLYGYDTEENAWISIGEGDYEPSTKELETCGDFSTASVSIAYPVLYSKPETLCVKTSYLNTQGQSFAAEGVLISAQAGLYSSGYSDKNGELVLDLYENPALYSFSYTDNKTGVKDVSFVSSSSSGECSYEASIDINSNFNAKLQLHITDENNESYAGEYVWLYDENRLTYTSALSDEKGNLSFDVEMSKNYKLESQSFDKNIFISSSETSLELKHKNISPAMFIYTSENKAKLHVIAYDADSKGLDQEVRVDDKLRVPFSDHQLGNSIEWVFTLDLDAAKAEIKVLDDNLYIKEDYYLSFDAIENSDFILNFIDPNGETIQASNLYGDVSYQINLIEESSTAASIEYFLDSQVLISPILLLQDAQTHILKIKRIYDNNSVDEKEVSIDANGLYKPPVISKKLESKIVNYNLVELFDIFANDVQGDLLKYDWKLNGAYISDLPTLNYIFDNFGSYTLSVEVSNRYKTSINSAIVSTAYASPVIHQDLNTTEVNVLAGSNQKDMTFSLEAHDPYDTVLTYKWFVNNVVVSLNKELKYSFEDLGSYDIICEVSNQYKTVRSSTKRINYFYERPSIEDTNVSPSMSINFGKENTFYVDAKDIYNSQLKYEWYINGTKVSESKSFSFSPDKLYKNYSVSLKVSNDFTSIVTTGSGYSLALWPIINSPQTYETISAAVGESTNLNIDATDPYGEELTYKWYDKEKNLLGTGENITHVFSNPSWAYLYCTVSNKYHEVSTYIRVNVDYQEPLIQSPLQDISNGFVGIEYSFDINASDPQGSDLYYTWQSFGTSSNKKVFSYTYDYEGSFDLTAIVSNNLGKAAYDSAEINVSIAKPSIIKGLEDKIVSKGEIISFEPLVGDLYNQSNNKWTLNGSIISNDDKLIHGFEIEGDYNLTYTYTNKYAKSVSSSAKISVKYDAPVLNSSNIEDLTVHRGQNYTFNADVSNTESGGLTYRWYLDDELLDNNDSSLSHKFISENQQVLKLEVLNLYKSVSAQAVITTVYDAPVFDENISSQSIKAGENFSFIANVSNPEAGDLRYEWYLDGVKQSETSSILTGNSNELKEVTAKCIAFNEYKQTESSAQLSVTYGTPEIIEGLSDLNTTWGVSKTFSVLATNPETDDLKYEWYINSIKVATAPTFTYEFIRDEVFTLSCKISNTYQSIETSARIQSFYELPIVTQGFENSSFQLLPDESIVLSVEASDPQGDNLRYKWFINGTEQSGDATSFSFSVLDQGVYSVWVKISNDYKSVYERASITVTDQQTITISSLPNAFITVYENNMSIALSVQTGADGTIILPVGGSSLNLGIIFEEETELDEETLHEFIVDTVLLNKNECFDLNNFPNGYGFLYPYFQGETSALDTADTSGDNLINSSELYIAALQQYDGNNDNKLQLGELLATEYGGYPVHAYVYHDLPVQDYTFKQLSASGTQLIETGRTHHNKCSSPQLTLEITDGENYGVNEEGFFTADNGETGTPTFEKYIYSNFHQKMDTNLSTMTMVYNFGDEEVYDTRAYIFRDINASAPSVSFEKEAYLSTERINFSNQKIMFSLYLTALIDNHEYTASSMSSYNSYNNSTQSLYTFAEQDIGSRYLSFDTLDQTGRDTTGAIYVFETYFTHNYILLGNGTTEVLDIEEPFLDYDRDDFETNLLNRDNFDIIEHTFYIDRYDKVFYLKEVYINEITTLPNYYNASNKEGPYLQNLFPEELQGYAEPLFQVLRGEGITSYESINGIQLKDDDLIKTFDVLQGKRTYEDLGIKKVKKVFSTSYLDHPKVNIQE